MLTITPGRDTALVVRTATSEGWRRAALAGAGIVAGLLVWGVLVALGLGVVLAASEVAYAVLKWVGAAYLVTRTLMWFGILILATAPLARALRRPRVLRWLDRMVGRVFVGFGVRLALSARR